MEEFSLLESLIAIAVVIVSGSIIAIRGFIDYKGLKSCDKKNEELQQSFDTIVERLSSESKASQLSNELEVGMAMMANIPVLLVKDDALNYGIFDEILSDYSLDTIKCHGNCFDLQRDPNLIKWLSKISH